MKVTDVLKERMSYYGGMSFKKKHLVVLDKRR